MVLLTRKFLLPAFILVFLFFLETFCSPADARTDPKALFDKGVKYFEKNNLKKAESYFNKTAKASFGNYPSSFNLSLLSLIRKDFKKSLKYLEEAKVLNPFDSRVGQMFTITHMMLNEYEESKKYLLETIAKNPADLTAHKKLGWIYLKENNTPSAVSEFTLILNLSPSDLAGNLLVAIILARKNDFAAALEKVEKCKGRLSDNEQTAFYAFVLEKNNQQEEADDLYDKIRMRDKEKIVENLLTSLLTNIILDEINGIVFIKEFENPDVTTRIAEKLKKEKELAAMGTTTKPEKKRPFGLKGTLVETFELVDRSPKTSNPINAMNVTSNFKVEGKTSQEIDLTGEWEGFFNRWDDQRLDFFKINTTKKNNYEVDIGKFSSKHFPALVSFPTVLDGLRVWKRITLPEFKPAETPSLQEEPETPLNLGEIYRENRIDNRSFKNVEITALSGRTLDRRNIGDRKEKNENTIETSGQFEQWTQSYRLHSEINKFVELGSSFAMTQDLAQKTLVTSTTLPINSIAMGIDGGVDLLDNDINLDAELAYSNYDLDRSDLLTKHSRDLAWIFKGKHKVMDTVSFTYEQKAIGRSFKVEGAFQTQDKITHTMDWVYQPKNPKTWFLSKQTIKLKPEVQGRDGRGSEKKRFRTLQMVTDFKLPQDSKYTLDYKYYKEKDKCGCTDYRTITLKNSLECKFPKINTTIKPSYTFERKDDMIAAPTDEKKNEYVVSIENTTVKNLKLTYSTEIEIKKFHGATIKEYHQYIGTLEAKYTFIPSRFDVKFKATQDYKKPTDTNKTDIAALTFEVNYTSQDGDDKFNLKYERKHNTYLPWSDSSAYRQNYAKVKYTHKF